MRRYRTILTPKESRAYRTARHAPRVEIPHPLAVKEQADARSDSFDDTRAPTGRTTIVDIYGRCDRAEAERAAWAWSRIHWSDDSARILHHRCVVVTQVGEFHHRAEISFCSTPDPS
jgi:hypothetical protein